MKSKIYFLLLIGMILHACQESKPPSEVVDDTIVEQVPNLSDMYFNEALATFKQSGLKAAAEHIEKGVLELSKVAEVNKLSGLVKSELAQSVKLLNELSTDVREGKIRDADRLLELFAKAEMTVSHDYLVTSDVYILESPLRANTWRNNQMLDRSKEAFDTLASDWSEDAREEAVAITKKTEELKAKRRQIEQDVSMHMQRMHEFSLKHKPEKTCTFYTRKMISSIS